MNLPIGEILCGDCLEIIKSFPNECIPLTITSPPYDQLRDYKGYSFDFEGIAKELYRVSQKGAVVVWVVGDQVIDGSESGNSFRQALFFKKIGFNLHDTMIYEKNGSQYPEKTRYYQCFEYMFVLSKGSPKIVNLLRDRKNLWNGSWGKRSRRNKNGTLFQAGKIPYQEFGIRFNIWRYNTGKGFSTKEEIAYDHPAIFPEALARDHILSWSNPKDIILDPMCGSGTVPKMAKLLNRDFIGIDIAEEYCKIAEARLAQKYLWEKK